jgi:two-component system response regulator AtoC
MTIQTALPFDGVRRGPARLGSLLGSSAAMTTLYDLIERGAPTNAAILITGETGTGKELVAATLHALSPRARGPFRALNCGAVSPAIADSELFGHERGSFTGADRQHHGYFEQASRGTLFLDEVAEMPGALQARLLRVLERDTLTRVGGSESIPVDVRLVAATNRPIAEAVASGHIREDLFYRLNVLPIHVPPLRERGEDAELLADHFLAKLNASTGTARSFTPAFRRKLSGYSWPGNVRELRNLIERAFILSDVSIDVGLWPAPSPGGSVEAPALSPDITIPEMERILILSAMDRLGGDAERAAAALGISTRLMRDRLRTYRHEGGPAAAARPAAKVKAAPRARVPARPRVPPRAP